ncbi:6-aminohexanoate-cyclic-dimer hydrolase [Streptomyces himastatinicus ATCC 53653]|uniref:6-aminohexanoate-cyclic-dimer hydrolase n=1 Tax=Streptomyces himastatinicus ATCC 53653 TaxID=457427 RepID=D9WQJ9_9ACTN|nr:amidase [Streptomyces himastatinicus]EFL28132.1 6-aminohexanoate-cyclic-dimer hydrolase [Streptomyces himastatinicus ATCC 53653]
MTTTATMDAHDQADLVRRGETSPRELVEAAIERIEATDQQINAITHRRYERALAEADRMPRDAPFAGVPTLTKALSDSERRPGHLRMRLGGPARPGRPGDSVITGGSRRRVHRRRPDLGPGVRPALGQREPRNHGVTRNPWRTDVTPGGSSGGASASVAAGMVPVAQGGDGGGSIRMPAAFCHLVGLKPSAGRISAGPGQADRWGHSVPAVVTRTVRDTAAVLDAVSGGAPGDRGGPAPLPPGGLAALVGREPGRLRVGVLAHAPDHAPQVVDAVRDAVLDTARILERLGHRVEEAHPAPMLDPRCLTAFFDALSVTAAQSVEALTRELGEGPGPGDLDPVTRFWVRRGREITGLELADALAWQNGLRAGMARWWQEFDLLLSPVFATPPLPVGWPWREQDGLRKSVDVLTFTAPFNTTGQPAIAVPAALTESGTPIGIQLAAAYGREDLLVRVAAQLEAERPWASHRPPVFATASRP